MTHDKKALITTSSLWVLFFIAMLLLPVPEREEEKKLFGEMSIQLAPLAQSATSASVEDSFEELLQQDEMSEVAQTENIVQETQTVESSPKPQPVETQAQQVPSEQSAPTPAEPRRQQVLAKSIEELMAEQNSRSQSSSEPQWSDDIFSESSAVASNQVQNRETSTFQSSSSLSGSAASSQSTSNSSDPVVSLGETARSSTSSSAVSSETSNLLSGIANAQAGEKTSSSSSSGSLSSLSDTNVQSNSSGYDFSFEGESRRLLFPQDPSLTISRENQPLIQATRRVTVGIVVSQNGTVSPSSITFTPSAFVPAEIQSELRQQIALWRFEEGSSSGQATFLYSIIVE